MNGYKMFAESYQKVLNENPDTEDKELLEKKIKIFSFLAECDTEDMDILYDTSAFNEYTKAYARQAMINCGLQDKAADVIGEIGHLHDTVSAAVILQEG